MRKPCLEQATLEVALDTSGLVWDHSPGAVWVGSHSAMAGGDSSNAAWALVPPVSSPPAAETAPWVETTVTGPGMMRFKALSWKYPSVAIVAVGEFPGRWVDATEFPVQPDGWLNGEVEVPPGVQKVRFYAPVVAGSTGLFGLREVRWEPGSVVTVAEALDLPAGVQVTVGGVDGAGWQGRAGMPVLTHDGSDAVVFHGSEIFGVSFLEAVVEVVAGPAVVSWWGMAHERAAHSVEVDGVVAYPPHGFGKWVRYEVILPAGSHRLRLGVDSGLWGYGVFAVWDIAVMLDEFKVSPLAVGPSLAAALDQPGWTVTTDQPEKVTAQTVPDASWDGVDSVLVGEGAGGASGPDQPGFDFVVPGPGLLGFRWRGACSGCQPPDVVVDGISAVSWNTVSEAAPSGWMVAEVPVTTTGAARVRIAQPGYSVGAMWVDALTFTRGPTLAQATGAPGLTWRTGGDAMWGGVPGRRTGVPGQSKPVSAAVSFPLGQRAWLETSVTGPGRFTCVVDGSGQFYLDGAPWYPVSGESRPLIILPAGVHRLRWVAGPWAYGTDGFAPVAGFMTLGNAVFTPSAEPDPVAQALDAPDFPWMNQYGGGKWERQTHTTFDGVDALRGEASSSGSGLFTRLPFPGSASIRYRLDAGATLRSGSLTAGPEVWGEKVFTPIDFWVSLIVQSTVKSPPYPTVDLDQFRWDGREVSLAEAMDAPGQVWETSAELPFVGFAMAGDFFTHDGVDAVMSRGGAEGAWLQTTVTGPARVSFFAFFKLGGTYSVDGGPAVRVASNDQWAKVSLEVGGGSHVLRWVKDGEDEYWGLDGFSVTPLAPGGSFGEAVDYAGPWLVDEGTGWSLSAVDAADGVDAALFPVATTPVAGPVRLPVAGPGRVEFWSKSAPWPAGGTAAPALLEARHVISQGYDQLVSTWAGTRTPGWTRHVIDTIPVGLQELVWPVVSSEEVAAGLDRVSYTPYAAVPLAEALESGGVSVTTNPALPWTGWQAGGAAWDGVDAAISGQGTDSWLKLTVPPGAGRLTYRVRAPGIERPNQNAPLEWKMVVKDMAAGAPREVTVTAERNAYWLDAVEFTPAATQLQAWLAGHGMPAGADLNSDADGDGRPLLLDYAFGFAPEGKGARDVSAPAGAGAPVFVVGNPEALPTLWCHFLRRRSGSGLRYEVFFTDDLSPLPAGAPNVDATSVQVQEISDEWERVTVTDQVSSSPQSRHRYGRVRVIYAP